MTEEHLLEKYKDILDLRWYAGFNCWEGWYPIINDMLTAMLYNHNHLDYGDAPKVVQIKEKFGVLRVYTDPYDPYTQGIIDMAVQFSEHTCEKCGQIGEYRGDMMWKKTLCDNHHVTTKLELAGKKR